MNTCARVWRHACRPLLLFLGLAVLAQSASAAWPRTGQLEFTPGFGFTFPQGRLNDASDPSLAWSGEVAYCFLPRVMVGAAVGKYGFLPPDFFKHPEAYALSNVDISRTVRY